MSGLEFAATVVQERAIKEVRSCKLQEPVSKRTYTVLKIQTNSGLVGYGKCAVLTTPEFEEAKKVIIGMPVTSYEVVAPLLSKNPQVLAGFNIAMLDVFGKATKAPVYQPLGGPTPSKPLALTSIAASLGITIAPHNCEALLAEWHA